MITRAATKADAERLRDLRVANRNWLAPFDPDTGDPEYRFTLQHAREWASKPGRYVILDEGEVVGGLSLVATANDSISSAMLGYWVAEDHGGRGLATAAVSAALEVAFGELGLHRVEAGTLVDNARSQRVLEKCGFTRVGVLREHLLIGGEWRDHYLYERLATDP
jgi:ribosomal-protein-alanine N-acetyltransferase